MATRFQSAYSRSVWFGIFVSFITDIVAAFLIAALLLTAPHESAIGVTAFLLAAVYSVQIGYGTWNAARGAAFHFLFEREGRVRAFVDEFRLKRYPRPDAYYGSAEDYFAEVVGNLKAPDAARLSAAAVASAFDTLSSAGHPLRRMFISMAAEEAIRRYDATFGPRKWGEESPDEDDFSDLDLSDLDKPAN